MPSVSPIDLGGVRAGTNEAIDCRGGKENFHGSDLPSSGCRRRGQTEMCVRGGGARGASPQGWGERGFFRVPSSPFGPPLVPPRELVWGEGASQRVVFVGSINRAWGVERERVGLCMPAGTSVGLEQQACRGG